MFLKIRAQKNTDMKYILFFNFLFPFISYTQTTGGVHFERNLDWAQVIALAKNEKKYILLDCYATWCGPCKMMDKKVYTDDSLGELVNKHFIPIKLQLDSTKNDPPEVVRNYKFAKEVHVKYNVTSLPTFLFFSPEGVLVHKGVGSRTINGFKRLVMEAANPASQYYVLLNKYIENPTASEIMPRLAIMARNLSEDSIAVTVARNYFDNYIGKLNTDSLFASTNLNFISTFKDLLSSTNRGGKFIFKNAERVNSIMSDKQFAQRIIDYIVMKEEVNPFVAAIKDSLGDIKWSKLERTIRKKYGEGFVERNVLGEELSFYKKRNDLNNYIKILIRRVEFDNVDNIKPSVISGVYLNNSAWFVFQHSSDKKQLKKALSWCEKALKMDTSSVFYPGNLDTKANILYKIGQKDKAIVCEQKAIARMNGINDREFKSVLKKMIDGIATWND